MNDRNCAALFARCAGGLVPIVQAICAAGPPTDEQLPARPLPRAKVD